MPARAWGFKSPLRHCIGLGKTPGQVAGRFHPDDVAMRLKKTSTLYFASGLLIAVVATRPCCRRAMPS